MTNIIGPDVSFYQDDPETPQGINFAKMKQSAEFVIIRAGQNLWPDPDFKYNWQEAKNAGMPRGCYWFFDSRANPKRQAELWYQTLEGDLGELPLFADLEESYGGQYAGWRQWYDFLERLKQLVGGKEISIYTAYYYWRDNAPNATTQGKNLEYFHQYPLWIAHYKTEKPLVPKPWSADEWLFWQFTEGGDGKLFGVESNGIDLNYFNGDLETFKDRFKPVTTEPPPPAPKPGPGTKHRVTVASLRMREGPGTNYKIIGQLKLNNIVVEITANTDRTWIKIKRDDGLIGWVSNDYLTIEEIPPATEPPPTTPPTPTGKMYRATSRLKVREGPGTTYNTLVVLETNDVVEEVGATTDRSWLQIKRSDGLLGWSFSAYLVRVDIAPPPPPPPPPIVEQDWYRVVPATLYVREGPSTTDATLGFLRKDDIIAASEVSGDKSWVKIKRVDGLTGWCHRNYLTELGKEQPATVRQIVFTGTTYFRKEYKDPRKIVAHILTIDLRAGEYHFIVTPPNYDTGVMCTRTASEFLEQFQVHIAINGDGFTYLDPAASGADLCPDGDAVIPNGYAASRGRIYSERRGPTVYINQKNEITFEVPKGSVFNAISGDRMVLVKGKPVSNLATNIPNPRTAIGLSQNGRGLIFITVDGREQGQSEGVNFPELADLLISFGAYSGINMDGGGSSTMVIKGIDGKPRVLNTPVDNNTPGKERSVANHLGIFIKR